MGIINIVKITCEKIYQVLRKILKSRGFSTIVHPLKAKTLQSHTFYSREVIQSLKAKTLDNNSVLFWFFLSYFLFLSVEETQQKKQIISQVCFVNFIIIVLLTNFSCSLKETSPDGTPPTALVLQVKLMECLRR